MRRGFTLIELLVASLLLGLLVSILTTIFSQSSIAWSTGVAGVVDMDVTRRDIAAIQASADSVIGVNGGLPVRAVSVFADDGMEGKLADRAFTNQEITKKMSSVRINDPSTWFGISVGGAQSASDNGALGSGKGYAVGITSAGPDKTFNTWDDITTWPTDE